MVLLLVFADADPIKKQTPGTGRAFWGGAKWY
jgi:hypothetical protein